MKRTVTILTALFWSTMAIGFAIVALFETNIVLSGDLSDNTLLDYYCTLAMELLTIAAIPFALRLFRFASVKRRLVEQPESLLRFASLRMMLIAIPMLINGFLYYMFMSTTFGYMGIICLLCMSFVYPSDNRCKSEISREE